MSVVLLITCDRNSKVSYKLLVRPPGDPDEAWMEYHKRFVTRHEAATYVHKHFQYWDYDIIYVGKPTITPLTLWDCLLE